jgi:hypothetical protein
MGRPQAIHTEDIDIFGDILDEYLEKFIRWRFLRNYVCPPELKADYLSPKTFAITFTPQRMASEDAEALNAKLKADLATASSSPTAFVSVTKMAKAGQEVSVLKGMPRGLENQKQLGGLAASQHTHHPHKLHRRATCSASIGRDSTSYTTSSSSSLEVSTRTKSLPPKLLERSLQNRAKLEAVQALAAVRYAETLSNFGPSRLRHEQESKIIRLRENQSIERLIVNGQWLSKKTLESLNTFWRQEALASLHLEELSAKDLIILKNLYLQKVSRLCGCSRASLTLCNLLELKHAAQHLGVKETHAAEQQLLQREIAAARVKAAAFPWIHRNLLPAKWTKEQQEQHLQGMVLAHYTGPQAMCFIREQQQWGYFAKGMPSEPFRTVQERFPGRVLPWHQKFLQRPLCRLMHKLHDVKRSSADFLCDHVPLLRGGRGHFVDEYIEGVMERVSEAEAEGGFSSRVHLGNEEEVGTGWCPEGQLSNEEFDRAVQQYWST